MAKKKRDLQEHYHILCEGKTEYNYFNEIKKKLSEKNIFITVSDMHGGGYSNIESEIHQVGTKGYLAIFVICDGDKAENPSEKQKLEHLMNFCKKINRENRPPCFLIVDSPDFEYIACLHDENYKGTDIIAYIKKIFKIDDLEKFKSDNKIYHKLNSDSRSYKIMLQALKKSSIAIVRNVYKFEKNFEVLKKIIVAETKSNLDAVGKKGSNINEIFEILLER